MTDAAAQAALEATVAATAGATEVTENGRTVRYPDAGKLLDAADRLARRQARANGGRGFGVSLIKPGTSGL